MQKSFLNIQPKYSKQEYQDNSRNYPLLDIQPLVNKNDFDFIYRPNDDSYLFIDTLLMELQIISDLNNKLNIAEIGCGSGFLINNLTNNIQKLNSSVQATAVDINFDACHFTKKVVDYYRLPVNVIMSSFLEGLKNESLDVVICNPPYVITDPEEDVQLEENLKVRNKLFKQMIEKNEFSAEKLRQINCLATSYAGGVDGCKLYPDIILNLHCFELTKAFKIMSG